VFLTRLFTFAIILESAPIIITRCQFSSNELKFAMRPSFLKTILSLSKQYYSIYISPYVNPNLGSSIRFFIIKSNLSKFSILDRQHLKPMIDLTILKIISILTCEPTMPMTWQRKYDRLINYYSWSNHQIKGLNGLTCITIGKDIVSRIINIKYNSFKGFCPLSTRGDDSS
jgi:hypothetical protein